MSSGFRLFKNLFKKLNIVSVPIVVIGLDRAGKTSIIQTYIDESFDYTQSTPTLGPSIENLNYQDASFICSDMGGQKSFRGPFWRQNLRGARGIVYVVDSSDKERFQEACEELWNYVLNIPEFESVPLLILANKQDVESAASVEQVKLALKMDQKYQHPYKIHPVSARDRNSIKEGFERWLFVRIIANLHKELKALESAKSL